MGIGRKVLSSIILHDLCVHCTAPINKCIPNIHTHLMGLNPFFQKQTLLLFTCPLQEDFVK